MKKNKLKELTDSIYGDPTVRTKLNFNYLIENQQTMIWIEDLKRRSGIRLKEYEAQSREIISKVLTEAKIPSDQQEELINFQLKYGGIQDNMQLCDIVWGFLHPQATWLPVNKIDTDYDEEENILHISCADIHPAHMFTMDTAGKLYMNWEIIYNHYEEYFEKLIAH